MTCLRTAGSLHRMGPTFDQLCKYLADLGGGYTLWVGAGASIALTKGATPGWGQLVKDIADDHGRKLEPSNDMPAQLETLSNEIGHHQFRKELRNRLVGPLKMDGIDKEVLVQQAIIGTRAHAVVSFNIDTLTGMAFTAGRGALTPPRTYLDRDSFVAGSFAPRPGPLAPSAYAPHGLLDVYGNCVMTKSEYLKHGMSLAVGTAVQLCLGGDLLILGMSISDQYLQEALIRHRKWIKDVFWVCSECLHPEWARVADVHVVQATHDEVWRRLAESHIAAEPNGTFAKLPEHISKHADEQFGKLLDFIHDMQTAVDDLAATLPADEPKRLVAFARWCEDLGLDVPEAVADKLGAWNFK